MTIFLLWWLSTTLCCLIALWDIFIWMEFIKYLYLCLIYHSKDRGPGGETFTVTAEINGALSRSVLDTKPKEIITTHPVSRVEGERFWYNINWTWADLWDWDKWKRKPYRTRKPYWTSLRVYQKCWVLPKILTNYLTTFEKPWCFVTHV